jgi:hypothetical protein
MNITNAELVTIQERLKGWLGHRPSSISLGVGSNVTIDFGEQLTVQATPTQTYVRGEWQLWVQHSCWRIEARNKVIAGSDDDRERLERALRYIVNNTLVAVELSPPAPDVVMRFDAGVVLRLFPFNFSRNYVHWSLYMPSRDVLVFGGVKPWDCVPET